MQASRCFSFQELEDGLKTCILHENIVLCCIHSNHSFYHDGQTGFYQIDGGYDGGRG